MITNIESQYTAEYIANVFWKQNIAKVSNITLIPYLKDCEIYSVAYITLDQWCDSEAAYNFIQRLKYHVREARIVHNDDNWWPVQVNTHNNGNLEVGSYTTWFPSSYFDREIELSSDDEKVACTECDETAVCSDGEYEVDDEEWEEFKQRRPIRGLGNDYYDVEEALSHLWILNENWDYAESEAERKQIETELNHFERELAIHDTVNRSANVTLRARQMGKTFYENQKQISNVKCS
jgi:hypothetical protein